MTNQRMAFAHSTNPKRLKQLLPPDQTAEALAEDHFGQRPKRRRPINQIWLMTPPCPRCGEKIEMTNEERDSLGLTRRVCAGAPTAALASCPIFQIELATCWYRYTSKVVNQTFRSYR